ncbi:protein WVD2-like 3 isoform X2 [Rhodamnia argentea]|nr:protein WVD2-like 3 isoform X2 [Rhodamnia argentea]XP_048131816.1 protein WVD2-like 3 isoform X2 [Rhodamnia argentea]
MEVTEDTKVAPHRDRPKEGGAETEDGVVEDKTVPHLEDEHSLEDLKGRDLQIKTGKETIKEEYKALDARNAGESQKDPVKKPKEAAKQKAKVTVPQPFSLATERRMSRERRASGDFSSSTEKKARRERRGSADFTNLQPKLSKSNSLNKPHFPSGARETHKPGHENSATATIKRTLTSKAAGRREGDNKEEVGVKNQSKVKGIKEAKSNSQVPMKKGETAETRKLGNSSTFKALPLPSFYHKNDPTAKSSTKKVSSTSPKSPLPCQRSKHPNSDSDAQKKTISNSAKQTINKLLKSAGKALNPSKER